MKLLLDVGNTCLKVGVVDNDGVKHLASIRHDSDWVGVVEKIVWPDMVSSIDIASVAGVDSECQLGKVIQKKFGLAPIFHRSKRILGGVVNGYRDYERLGIDRWLAIVAAFQRIQGPLCVADCGTSLTIDLVTAKGEHLGGYILPGMVLARKSLLGGTRQVVVSVEEPPSNLIWGKSSEEAVGHGTLLFMVASIEKAVQEFQRSTGEEPRLVLTGGDAAIIKTHLGFDALYIPELVLEGLYCSTKLS